MRKIVRILILLIVFACDSQDANDCFQTSGAVVQEIVEVSDFNKILVDRNIKLILRQGASFNVIVESGENLINDVDVSVNGQQLRLVDNNTCNYFRDYAATKVYVTAPDIKEIRSSTQFTIETDGVFSVDEIRLLSEDFNAQNAFTVGDFNMQLMANDIEIVSNNLSSFYLSGHVTNLFVGFYSGAGRFEGENLIAENVEVYHRGSNDMIINPQLELTGELLGTGNLIITNEPPIMNVEQIYTGEVIVQ